MFFALAHILVSYLFCFNLQPCKTHLDKILILFTKLLKSNNYQIVFCYFIYFIVFLAFSDLTRFPCIDFWAKKWTFPAIEKRPKFHEFSFLFQVSCHKLRDISFGSYRTPDLKQRRSQSEQSRHKSRNLAWNAQTKRTKLWMWKFDRSF